MGDVAMSLHAINALRTDYPSLKIVIVTKERFARFYEGISGTVVLTIPQKAAFSDLAALVRKLKTMNIGYVADIHNTIRGKFIRFALRLSGAKVACLDKMRPERRKLLREKASSPSPLRHNVLRFCDVFARLGFPVHVPEVRRIHKAVPAVFGTKDGKWAGFAPFASTRMKIYPEEGRVKLISMLSRDYGKVFIFTGPGKEKEFADRMQACYPNVVPVFGKTDLQGEIDLMSSLDVMITMDSSAMHMASLTGVPVVSVWGSTHPAAGFSAYGSRPEISAVQLDLPCRPCSVFGKGTCLTGDYRCLRDITPEMIMEKVKAMDEDN